MIDQEKITNVLEKLRHMGDEFNHPSFLITYDDYGNDWYKCQFCGEEGIFPSHVGGIEHSDTCPVSLAKRIVDVTHFFDNIAFRAILHQLSEVNEWPVKLVDNMYVTCCPFCEQTVFDENVTHDVSCIISQTKHGRLLD